MVKAIKEKKKKKELGEDLEYLRQIEVPESQGGGRKFVADYEKDKEKKEKDEKDAVKTFLEGQGFSTYRERLSNFTYTGLKMLELPEDWEYYSVPTSGRTIDIFGRKFKTQEGVLIILRDPDGNVYVKGIKTTNNPEYDVNAIDILLVQVENTVDSYKGILLSDNKDTMATFKKRPSGIYEPN